MALEVGDDEIEDVPLYLIDTAGEQPRMGDVFTQVGAQVRIGVVDDDGVDVDGGDMGGTEPHQSDAQHARSGADIETSTSLTRRVLDCLQRQLRRLMPSRAEGHGWIDADRHLPRAGFHRDPRRMHDDVLSRPHGAIELLPRLVPVTLDLDIAGHTLRAGGPRSSRLQALHEPLAQRLEVGGGSFEVDAEAGRLTGLLRMHAAATQVKTLGGNVIGHTSGHH